MIQHVLYADSSYLDEKVQVEMEKMNLQLSQSISWKFFFTALTLVYHKCDI